MQKRRIFMQLERMDDFFNTRAEIYDSHMLDDLQLEAFYVAIADCFPKENREPALLDLGVGTGLELARLFEQFPGLKVTGIDLSQGMLDILKEKYRDKKINAVCGSYFDIDFGKESYDFALSTYSLHHFSEEGKEGVIQEGCSTRFEEAVLYSRAIIPVKRLRNRCGT
jgi:tRNA (cmo5U34)-methyltransferase